ncbi:hypothetical protein G9A89_010178 [Geosiphon pyriformis]|nr:hypothetical protein G9A89_010178 [Geosiphon pyriformis]
MVVDRDILDIAGPSHPFTKQGQLGWGKRLTEEKHNIEVNSRKRRPKNGKKLTRRNLESEVATIRMGRHSAVYGA